MLPRISVAVVGAGPVGLTTALLLASRGIPTIVIERRPAPDPAVTARLGVDPPPVLFVNGSRAVVTQRASLDVWDQADPLIAKRLNDVGVTWTRKETWWGRRRLFSEEYASSDHGGHPPFVNVPQATVEYVLEASARRFGDLITIRHNTSVVRLEQDDDGVRLTTAIEGPATVGAMPDQEGPEDSIYADWVVAADGPRSTVRDLLKVNMPRNVSRNWFVIADVRDVKAQFPFGDLCRRFYYHPPADRGGQLLVMPQPDGVWRLDWQSPRRLDLDFEMGAGRLDERVRRIVGDTAYELEWTSQYRFENNVAERFRAGRVLLAGDAAHRLSPFGGRGMNSGIADAAAAADAIETVVRSGLAGALDEYDIVRRDAALVNMAATSRALRVMEPPTLTAHAVRVAALAAAPWSTRARRYVDTGPYTPDKRISTSGAR